MLKKIRSLIQHPHYLKGCIVIFSSAVMSILFLSLKSGTVDLLNVDGFDKIQHAGAYFILGLITALLVRGRQYCFALIILWLMSGCVELIQSFEPSRQGSVYDWGANFVGLVLAYIVSREVKKFIVV
ncbi:VanZ family protein [Vibrio cyclitrophicus]|uniref:VanZ family protein n=1 Tax=Vibrio cyclitrophicus TaxID=47951 RepID=UPI0002FA9BB7|nr:VanZ family protein [Vibrio cyclitrophicus]OED75332.1 hypothetical protein OAS_16745 [Vibrio cyclitrophicus ZF65]PMJ78616.1 hypothetical protein BCU15_13260 [Vibrio cyclitrophicus]PMK23547.1 hypothetical protein BCU04_15365 [Vibrio cyclitrophicus]